MINPQPYTIQRLNCFEQRAKEQDDKIYQFKRKIWAWIKANDPQMVKYPKWLLQDFVAYWTAYNDNGRKMYYEMEKKWNTGLRLATWKRNAAKDPRWKTVQPSTGGAVKMKWNKQEDSGIDYERYKQRMENQPVNKPGNIGSILKEQFRKE